MTVALPGYPRPNTTEVKGFRIEVVPAWAGAVRGR